MNVAGYARRTRFGLVAVVGLALALVVAPWSAAAKDGPRLRPQDPAIVGYPNSIASTGDSITRAFNTGTIPFTDAPANSWSTGTNGSVNSHYSRILAANPAINGHNYNDAVTGAQMTDLLGQVSNVVPQNPAYVTILLGANDACTATEAQMTAVTTYRAQFQTALVTLAASLPNTRIYVLSVPNIYNLWSVLHSNTSAQTTWALFSICQSMLVNPTSMAQADVDRRARVQQRVVDYNTQLAQVCGAFPHCRFDNNAVYNTTFLPSDVSTRDYFHPALSGQAKLAAVSYAAGFDFTDMTPPVSVGTNISTVPTRLVLQITATDNVGVAGIEYKLNNGGYTAYTGPVPVARGGSITYRAVDVNGNIEATHFLAAP
jgi:lysophospholipase L1-like esterase